MRTSWRRDALGRPVEQRIGAGGRPSASPARNGERVRTYGWQQNDRLSSIDDSTLGATRYQHDAVGNLAATLFADGLEQLRTPDAVGNLFQTAGRTDRRYGPAGQLLEAGGTRYAYDEAGNLKQRTLPTGEQWHYAWHAAGHLAEVLRPDGGVVRFTYDALGRRVSKSYRGRVTRWVWDGNQPLHEWTELELNGHNTEEVITWLFEPDSFAPLAKLQGDERQSIVCDHLGTPLEVHDQRGQLSWAAELDSYGAVRQQRGEVGACPFRYQGQYEDVETGLYYNRFRYYDPHAGQYVSQDPVGLGGMNATIYAYVKNTTLWIDIYGLNVSTGKGRDHVTYRGIKGGKPYTGYASAPSSLNLSKEEIISRRYNDNFDGFGGAAPTPVYNGTGVEGKRTARGLEQHYYEEDVKQHKGRANVANRQNPVGENNPRRDKYTKAKNKHLKSVCKK